MGKSFGKVQELSSVGHPQVPGEQPVSPTSLCPSLACCCFPTAEKSQNVLALKAPTKIIKVQRLKGPVQISSAFCFPSGLCCSANPAQASQLRTQSLAAVSGHSCAGEGRGGTSVHDAQPDTSCGHCPSAWGCSPLQGSPLRAAAVGMAGTDGAWHSAVPSTASLPCWAPACVRMPGSHLQPHSQPASKNRLWKTIECKYGPWQGEKLVLCTCAASLRGFWSPRSVLQPVT